MMGKIYDVAIIGSGPAALTAAIYTTRGAASTIILAGGSWGGQLMLTTDVDNFPGFPDGIKGPELMANLRKQVERFGAEFVAVDVTNINADTTPFVITAGTETYKAKSIIIATGADTKWLGVPGEDKLRGRGISSCAPCDAPFFKDKNVAVVGGGDAAMEEALVLTKYSPKVTIIHRRDKFRASIVMQKRVRNNEKIFVIWDTEVVEIKGENSLSSLYLKTKVGSEQYNKLKSGEMESVHGGKEVEEKENFLFWEFPTEGAFVAIGHTPATKNFKGLVELDEKGYIKRRTVEDKNTNLPLFTTTTNINGIFVAGDVNDVTYKQAITAAGFGCQAGMDVLRYLDKTVQHW